jgi:hypothetical protein
MPRRFNDRPVTESTRLGPDEINDLIVPLDRAIATLEETRISWLEQVELFNTNGLKRVSEAVAPLLAQISSAIDGGLLVAQTDDNVGIPASGALTFYIAPGSRVAFRPTPFLAITAPDDPADWAMAQLDTYSTVTGLMNVTVLYRNGSAGTARTGWYIAASAGVVPAVEAWADQASDSAAAAAASAAAALASQTAAAASASSASGSAATATTKASEATAGAATATTKASEASASAAAAAASAASVAGGPVASVNGRTGIVTGIAEAADVTTLAGATTTALATKANQATTYTKTEVDAAIAASATPFATIFKYM